MEQLVAHIDHDGNLQALHGLPESVDISQTHAEVTQSQPKTTQSNETHPVTPEAIGIITLIAVGGLAMGLLPGRRNTNKNQ